MNKKEIKNKIKDGLWPRGYTIRDMEYETPNADYDLLVNNKFRVKIVEDDSDLNKELSKLVNTKKYDVLAYIYENKKYFASKKTEVFTRDHGKVFEVKNDTKILQLGVGEDK